MACAVADEDAEVEFGEGLLGSTRRGQAVGASAGKIASEVLLASVS